ncbi:MULTISPECIES: PstS family phosphate ABC transporter substrate-binding protein [unclassified Nostoc]|uniref:PstS family phosphate ABC transporter substrate-binding protein n=1 Tax=unclassified Nostoc TaxID=2593658 RepID=UPI002AD2E570|nr:substrate-binding domain-containing protein [Nostoc sp. DedQUE03]MDZ7974552.1 substrate-binding domain-containing protein [Nostoc sp. DedQUE03]MDZ8047044.1 substrate-binding domain-containing protein [Nostoc sp. DedQUE02]
MTGTQVLTAAKFVMNYIDKIYLNEDNILQLDIKQIHKEIENFHQEVLNLIQQKCIEIKDIKQGKSVNNNSNSNSDIYQYLSIDDFANETENLVSKLTEKSERIKKEATDSEEFLSYFKAIAKYFELFKEDTFKKSQHDQPVRRTISTILFSLNKQGLTEQEQAEAIQTISVLNSFKNTVQKHYIDIKIKYIDLDKDLSKHWTSRTLKKLFYKINKNPLKMTALLVGSTTLLIGTTIFSIKNYSNMELYIKYMNLPKREFSYSQVGTWDDINKEIVASKELAKLKLNSATYDPRTAVNRLIKGEIDFVQSISSPSSDQSKEAKEIEVKLKTVSVGYYLIAIAVNQELNLQSITFPELKKIYTGEITNWKQLGGQDLKITPYKLGDKHPNTMFFKDSVLSGRDFSEGVVTVDTNTEALQQLKQKDPGGIYFGSASEIVDQCLINTLSVSYTKQEKPISVYQEDGTYNNQCSRKTRKQSLDGIRDNYAFKRQIFVIFREDDKNNSIGDFYTSWLLSEKGQKVIKKANFIPIK